MASFQRANKAPRVRLTGSLNQHLQVNMIPQALLRYCKVALALFIARFFCFNHFDTWVWLLVQHKLKNSEVLRALGWSEPGPPARAPVLARVPALAGHTATPRTKRHGFFMPNATIGNRRLFVVRAPRTKR